VDLAALYHEVLLRRPELARLSTFGTRLLPVGKV
jgi:hypothetical protein